MLTLVFSGTTIEIVYLAGPHLGTLALEVDDTVLRTVITTADQTAYQQTAILNYLTDEPHTLRVYAQEGGVVAVDAFVMRLPDITRRIPLPPESSYEIAYNCGENDVCLRTPIVIDPIVQITSTHGYIAPEWSPSGRQILYHRGFGSLSGLGILERDANDVWHDLGLFARTPDAVGSHKSWSPDGKKILYATAFLQELQVIDLTQCEMTYGTEPPPLSSCPSHVITSNLASGSHYYDPSWAPDSRRFVFRHRGQDADQISRDHIYTTTLIFSSNSAITTELDLRTEPDLPSNENYVEPAWSPVGDHIIVSYNRLSYQPLVLLDSLPAPHITSGNNDHSAAWSPNGTQLVYVHADSFPTHLYLISSSGGTATDLGLGSEPSWRRTTICTVPAPPDRPFGISYYRAPITFNPREGNLTYRTDLFRFELDAYFTDNRDKTWYRVARVLDNSTGQPPIGDTNAAEVEAKGGVWVKGSEWGDEGPSCGDPDEPSSLRYAHEYDIPTVDWNSFGFFSLTNGIPVTFSSLCNGPQPIQGLGLEMRAIGYPPPEGIGYPRSLGYDDGGLHHGLDLFVQVRPAIVEARSVGSDDGIVVGIGVGGPNGPIEESHALLDEYSVDISQGNNWYSVVVRYGHLYVLYGHLNMIPDTIWVGALVRPGDLIGIVGEQSEGYVKHLHLEVFSYEIFPPWMDGFGILPYNTANTPVTKQQLRQAFFYDFMQLVDNSTAIGEVANLTPISSGRFPNQATATLTFAGCSITYHTRIPDSHTPPPPIDPRMEQNSGYRGFHYNDEGETLPSPLTIPNHP